MITAQMRIDILSRFIAEPSARFQNPKGQHISGSYRGKRGESMLRRPRGVTVRYHNASSSFAVRPKRETRGTDRRWP